VPEELLSPAPESLPGDPPGARLGFYGKLPARGDFLTRRLPRGFVEPWDQWLQEAIAASRAGLGDDWLALYLEAPIWRFVLAAGLCGEAAVAGIVMPSVDRVGRYFPLTLAATLPTGSAPAAVAQGVVGWFAALEDLALTALDDGADLDAFDAAVAAAALPDLPPSAAARQHGGAVVVELADPAAPESATQLLDGVLAGLGAPPSLWSTSGSERVKPATIAAAGLPPAQGFAALLDGDWERWGWNRR
jgi:type VI secretion system protein ImpM